MRIIAGSRKGARIFAPRGLDTRPTGDRVREAVFNLIGPVDGAEVLDLYAGSGAMGLEALSRGAERVTFVESDREAAETIVRNLDKLKLDGRGGPPRGRRPKAGRRCRRGQALRSRADRSAVPHARAHPPHARRPPARRRAPQTALAVVESGAREEPDLPLPKRTSRRYGSARVTVFEAAP